MFIFYEIARLEGYDPSILGLEANVLPITLQTRICRISFNLRSCTLSFEIRWNQTLIFPYDFFVPLPGLEPGFYL